VGTQKKGIAGSRAAPSREVRAKAPLSPGTSHRRMDQQAQRGTKMTLAALH